MTVLTEMQRQAEYVTFCTQPVLRELVENCVYITNQKNDQKF